MREVAFVQESNLAKVDRMESMSARSLVLLSDGWRGSRPGAAYAALADRIRLLIVDGRISLGARLPAERDLSAHLGVSRTTVAAAYAQLRSGGYLHSVRGSGSVAALPDPAPRDRDLGRTPGDLLDFSKASVPAWPGLGDAARRAAGNLPAFLGGSGYDPIGLPVLRTAIAERYERRGLPTTADQVMVTIGAQHAIALIARAMLSRGDPAIVESPSYPHAFEALRGAGARLVPVGVTTDDGWDEDGFERAIQRTSPSLAYLMPDFQNPTGCSMSPEFRQRAVVIAARHGTTLVADETMAELRIDGAHPRHEVLPLAAYGRGGGATGGGGSGGSASATGGPGGGSPGGVILIGSLGKTVWGGIRIGWIRADRAVIQRLVRARAAADLGTPLLEQLVAVEVLRDYDAILDIRRAQLRAGRDLLGTVLAARLPEWQVPVMPGGLAAWVNLGSPVSSQLALAARGEGLQIAAGPLFGIDGAFERFLRIPFSYPAAETERAVDMLAAAWRAVGRHPVVGIGTLADVV